MATEGKGPIVIPCYLVDGVPYVLEVDANGKLAVRAAEIETLLAGGLPVALDSGALKVKEQSPISGFATSAKQDTLAGYVDGIETLLSAGLPAALDAGALKVKEQSPISGFATSANQATMITALQLIDDLRAALGSVNTDDLQVDVKTIPTVTVQATGGDKLLSLESIVADYTENWNLSPGETSHPSSSVPTGKLWVITHVNWVYLGTIPGRVIIQAVIGGAAHNVEEWVAATQSRTYGYPCLLYLPTAAYLQVVLVNATAGNAILFSILGYQMDAP